MFQTVVLNYKAQVLKSIRFVEHCVLSLSGPPGHWAFSYDLTHPFAHVKVDLKHDLMAYIRLSQNVCNMHRIKPNNVDISMCLRISMHVIQDVYPDVKLCN